MDYDFNHDEFPQIIDRKIAYGTENFLHSPAMNPEQWQRALDAGAEMVDECFAKGCNIVSFGEMGIANTSPSSVLMHLFLNIPLDQCVGAGSGLPTEGIRHKYDVLKRSVDNFHATMEASSPCSAEETCAYFCGYEMAAAIGGMLRAASHRMIILVDGFIMTACMLGARAMDASVMDYAVFGHCGDEGGHRLMLNAMGAEPLLNLGLRLGEGTGAICAFPIVQSAVNMINEMDNFAHASITKYF